MILSCIFIYKTAAYIMLLFATCKCRFEVRVRTFRLPKPCRCHPRAMTWRRTGSRCPSPWRWPRVRSVWWRYGDAQGSRRHLHDEGRRGPPLAFPAPLPFCHTTTPCQPPVDHRNPPNNIYVNMYKCVVMDNNTL